MGKRRNDVEAGVGGTFYYQAAAPPPPQAAYQPPREAYVSWLMPLIFVVDVLLFVYTMYVNDCPSTYEHPNKCLFKDVLGRFSFLPLHENRLIGPSSSTLENLGGLRLELVQEGEWWRLLSCLWLHAGLIHLIANMVSLLFIGVRLEEEFAFWRIGPIYVISGFGGSLMSCLNTLQTEKTGIVSVGASGALFGLLGAMLSELITNWSIYANKCSALLSLMVIVALNLAVGLIPGVDSSAHIGGFVSGVLLGFILLIRPQYGYVSRKYLPADKSRKSRHKWYQYLFLILSLIGLIVWYIYGLTKVFETADTASWSNLKT
ncbi:hypothetical protein vseg_007169 [Gypsophila vaccaria]